MNGHWPNVRLGDVLVKSHNAIEIDPVKEYQEVTVRIWGKGVTLRGIKAGIDIGSGRRFQVSTGQFIVSRIDARHGAFGLIPQELDGAIVTNDFPTFITDQQRLLPAFLNWLSKTPAFVNVCRAASEGTTNRVRLKENEFLNIKIALPPLGEQQRIVAKIESLTSKIDEARKLREEILEDAHQMLLSAFKDVIADAEYRPMAEVAPIIRRKVAIDIDGEYPELGVRSFGKGTFQKPVLHGHEVGSKKLYFIEPGDLVFSNVFSWEGAIAVAKPTDNGRVGSHRFITCIAKQQTVTAPFLCFYFLAREGLEKIREASPGGAGRNRTLGLKKLEKITVPVPDYNKQLWFDSLQQKVAAIKQAQADSQTELDALLPSILDKAFKGEL